MNNKEYFRQKVVELIQQARLSASFSLEAISTLMATEPTKIEQIMADPFDVPAHDLMKLAIALGLQRDIELVIAEMGLCHLLNSKGEPTTKKDIAEKIEVASNKL